MRVAHPALSHCELQQNDATNVPYRRLTDMWIPQLPRKLWWSHNAYYHQWLLRHLPQSIGSALDVGCGKGDLARALANRTDQVDAVDASHTMIERASAIESEVNWLPGDILDETLPLRANGYDVVTAVSSLHHMPLTMGLNRLAKPGSPRWPTGNSGPVPRGNTSGLRHRRGSVTRKRPGRRPTGNPRQSRKTNRIRHASPGPNRNTERNQKRSKNNNPERPSNPPPVL